MFSISLTFDDGNIPGIAAATLPQRQADDGIRVRRWPDLPPHNHLAGSSQAVPLRLRLSNHNHSSCRRLGDRIPSLLTGGAQRSDRNLHHGIGIRVERSQKRDFLAIVAERHLEDTVFRRILDGEEIEGEDLCLRGVVVGGRGSDGEDGEQDSEENASSEESIAGAERSDSG